MDRLSFRLIVISTLVLCSCIRLVPNEDTSGSITDINLMLTLSPPPDGMSTTPYASGRLYCTTYIEARWGTEVGAFGLCSPSSEAWIKGPYPPVPGERGELFILDKVNRRIVKYNSESIFPQVISLPASYRENPCGYGREWSNLSVSGDRIFLRYSGLKNGRFVERVAVLSFEGEEIDSIDLEPYYPLSSPYLNSLIADRKGGVYVQLIPAGLVHFDSTLQPMFIPLEATADYEDVVVGWDGNLYIYDADQDVLRNYGMDDRALLHGESVSQIENVIAATSVVSPTYVRLLGADVRGLLYFSFLTYEGGYRMWTLRLSRSTDGRVLTVLARTDLLPDSLGPDGSLYSITYEPTNPAIMPKIIKCVFADD